MSNVIHLRHGDCVEVLAAMEAGTVGGVVSDPPYGLEFMGKAWDDLCNHNPEGMRKGDAARITNVEAVGGFQDGAGGNPFSRSRVRYGANLDRKLNSMQEWHLAWLVECYRVLVPGGVIKAFSATRTFHRMATAMQEAGFTDIRLEAWNYGSGFPKSLSVASAIDKAARGTPQGSTKGDPQKRGRGTLPSREVLAKGGKDGGATTGLTNDYGAYVPTTPAARTWDGWGTALKPSWEPVLVGTKPA